ncbi:inversin protein alternative isoform, putative [hydrothermal vent metagenome]|uniref:Inversin protein alternative isoform, putative n=1 Tax=hydrothermal vent metagenome TaxID=652676 RepID=A0A1W1D111_9ZZZZ
MIVRKTFFYPLIVLVYLGLSTNIYAQVTEQDVLRAVNQGVKATKKFLATTPTYQLYEKNKTILHYAVELNKYDVVEFLTRNRVNLARKGGMFFQTPLQDAIYYRHFRIAKLLINRGSPLDSKNVNGETALHIAAKNGYSDIVKALLAKGASTNIPDEDGNLPYELVPKLMFENDKELLSILKPEENENENGNSDIATSQIIKIDVPMINKTRTITIDGKNKTIDDQIIDDKSRLKNNDFGITID